MASRRERRYFDSNLLRSMFLSSQRDLISLLTFVEEPYG